MNEADTKTIQQADDDSVVSTEQLPESLSTLEGTAPPQESAERLVPVSEARRYRKRAQAAEQRIQELEQDLHDRREQLARREQQLNELTTQRAIQQALHEHEVIDADVAALLIENQIDDDGTADIDQAVHELRQRKPYLFRPQRSSASTTALGIRTDGLNGQAGGQLEHAAEDAIRTGRRGELLRYLSLRRRLR